MIILGTNSVKAAGGFNVANSCRFNRGSSDYLSRSTGVTTTNTKYTLSFWIKLCDISNYQSIFEVYKSSNERVDCGFNLDNSNKPRFVIQEYTGSYIYRKIFTRLFRDTSAWYNFIVKFDSSEAEANRLRVYINGIEETETDTVNLPSSGASSIISVGTQHIGYSQNNSGHHLNGYLAEFVLIEGTDYDPTSFGEFDSDSGIWKPIDVSDLTFGTNGFYLDFEDSSALGDDVSGNGNNFTANNLTAIDQSTDTCTNNFAVGNPLLNYNPQLTEGNLVLTSSGTAWKNSMSTIGVTSGIWYHEVKITAESGVPYGLIGVTDSYHPNSWGASPPNYLGIGALQIGYYNDNGTYYQNDGQQSYSGNGFGVNDTIGVLLNLDAGTPTIKFYKNDADQGAINLPTNSNSTGLWFFMQSMYIQTCSVNYGSPAHAISSGNQDGNGYGNFEFETKGGYTLNTKNLAEYG